MEREGGKSEGERERRRRGSEGEGGERGKEEEGESEGSEREGGERNNITISFSFVNLTYLTRIGE